MAVCHIAMGSNLGDRRALLAQALDGVGRLEGTRVLRVSSFYETTPVGGPVGQGAYLNAAAEVETTLSPEGLLKNLHTIEAALGRVREGVDGPRTVDLDLLLYGSEKRATPSLTLPHPRLHERLFVLDPLADLVPGLVHPVLGKTIAALRFDLLGVRRVASPLRVLVTGSTSGIGRAIALRLASEGASVVVHGRRSRDAAQAVAQAVVERGGAARVVMADLRSDGERNELASRAWDAFAGLDAVVNNAGADTLTGEAANWTFERKLHELWSVDVQATMHLSRVLGRRMKEAGGGTVVNMGWDQAELGMEGDSGELFAATKGAVMCFTRSLALSLAPEVRTHCVAPGWIRTEWGEGASEVWQDRVRRETPLKCWGTPEDVAAMVGWLLSAEARYFNGQVVRVDGGAVR